MKVSYDRLWKLMIDKKINKKQIKDLASINCNCIAKMAKDEPVHMENLIKICESLNCELNDIVEIKENEEDNQSV